MPVKEKKCPNCQERFHVVHPENGCVLASLTQVVREREIVDEEKLLQLHENTDVSALWDDLGPIIDKLEEGKYLVKTYLLKDGTTTTSTHMEGQYVCKHCGSSEVVYQQGVDDARCQDCGTWQN